MPLLVEIKLHPLELALYSLKTFDIVRLPMKNIYQYLLVAALLGFSAVTACSQTVTVYGVENYDASTPMHNDYYWSIYGNNLSTGDGSSVYFTYAACTCGTQNPPTYTTLGYSDDRVHGYNPGGWWYESSGQINFYVGHMNYLDIYGNQWSAASISPQTAHLTILTSNYAAGYGTVPTYYISD